MVLFLVFLSLDGGWKLDLVLRLLDLSWLIEDCYHASGSLVIPCIFRFSVFYSFVDGVMLGFLELIRDLVF